MAEVERPADAGVDFSELRVIHTEGEYQFQASTGYFGTDATAYLRYLDELLLADELYLVTDKGHRPLQLLTSTLVDEYDDADLVARTFSFRILDTVENFSVLPAAAPVPLRATRWRGVSLVPILDAYGKRTGKLVFQRLEQVYADDASLVKPYTVKANAPGDPDYIPPIVDHSILVGSTPYPSAAIVRAGTFRRTTCGAGFLGGRPRSASKPAATGPRSPAMPTPWPKPSTGASIPRPTPMPTAAARLTTRLSTWPSST
ncbi:hypothetical protein GBK04_25240 [Cytophagaceae bacterium SJW1-29]|uniref:Uncharacterized protein n=1 Tax=Salmonirosea aquatica TaxID=2654236 RepID=A0A7C9BKT2_9BACT|nr:hypothetical protein [Cytophagaceae bacterium SJW1-29]